MSERLRIELTVEGGFAPLGRGPDRFRIDRADLSAPDAADLRELVRTVAREGREPIEVSGMPDVFVYHLIVSGDVSAGPVTFDDVTATTAMHALVTRIRELAEPRPSRPPPGAEQPSN